ncbi:hypothetical protein ALC62_11649 [Cyphomyrmex costatus]|uniref:Uncharacterized protein n=1 Tax=Cyphomyrmex costatus TaxID=456900 RepID=A0A151ICL1_9HYME|nr:hypothetical protein ALC62_11649 [Cyphomyrmex costatus]
MMTETSIRLAPQVDFTAAVMMGGHADRTCFDGADFCTCDDAPWLPLFGQCVLAKPHPIWNLVILTILCRKRKLEIMYIVDDPLSVYRITTVEYIRSRLNDTHNCVPVSRRNPFITLRTVEYCAVRNARLFSDNDDALDTGCRWVKPFHQDNRTSPV